LFAASSGQLDRAGNDSFLTFAEMIQSIERVQTEQHLSQIKDDWWKLLNSYTHTGWRRIAARLTADGRGYNYTNGERMVALGFSDRFGLLCAMELRARRRTNKSLMN
jgi:hypothetical protein